MRSSRFDSTKTTTHTLATRLREDREGLARTRTLGPARLATRATAIMVLATIGVCSMRAEAQVGLNLVLDTGTNTPLPPRITADPTIEYLTIGPSNPVGTFNGVTIRYLGTESVAPIVANPFVTGPTSVGTAARYFVSGDLNLLANQKIFGIGPNLIKLEVGNNATFAAGSGIDVSAEGARSGAGGGAGGAATPAALQRVLYTNGPTDFSTQGGGGGAGGTNLSPVGKDGAPGGIYTAIELREISPGISTGTPYTPGTAGYANLFRAVPGGNGSAGQGNLGTSVGGTGRSWRIQGNPGPDPLLEQPTPGAKGTGGSVGIFGGNGGPGVGGGTGGNGPDGLSAGDAQPITTTLNPSVVSLRAGNGGGAGGTGGVGIPGATGGGGGGGGAGPDILGTRAAGGAGGVGGAAGGGGGGGLGGEGGGGGGGIQLIVRGSFNMASGSSILATGADGKAGQLGGAGGLGAAGSTGGSGSSGSGRGGNGGFGGNGGRGGDGGDGTGGSGGVIQIAASSFTFNGFTDVIGGLRGDRLERSANGESYFHSYSGPSTSFNSTAYFGARAAGTNPYRSYSSSFTLGGAPSNLVPNVPYIEGGAAPYGVLADDTGIGLGVQLFTNLVPSNGRKRLGAVTRVGADFLAVGTNNTAFTNDSQQLILYTAFENDLQQPALRVVDPSHQAIFGDYVPAAPVRLRAGNGYLNDPTVTPGAVAPTDMASLPAFKTFAMYTSGTQVVTASARLYGDTRTFTGTPTSTVVAGVNAPGASTVFIEDRGVSFVGFQATSNSGGPVAGFESELQNSGEYVATAAGTSTLNLRAGDTGSVFGSLYGSGNAGTYVNGAVRVRTLKPQTSITESGPLFTQISTTYNQIAVDQSWNTNAAQIVTTGLSVGTTNRVAEVIFNPDYDDTTRTIVFPVFGRIFSAAPQLQGAGISGSTFTLDEINADVTASGSFSLLNADVLSSIDTSWRNAIRQRPQLIRMTVLGYELIDPAGVFTVGGLGTAPFTLDGNQSRTINVGFDPTGFGDYTATLRLLTDVNAPLGQAGETLTITLSARAIPEPTSLLSLGVFGGLLLRRRTR